MDIAIIADDNKKELMTQFCIAYCGILARHRLSATSVTGKYITDATATATQHQNSVQNTAVQPLLSAISASP